MATIKIDTFGGIAPRQHPTKLADGMAVMAHNVRLKTGKLVPLRQPSLLKGINTLLESGLVNIADAQSIHPWRKQDGTVDFLLFKGVTWMSEGNIANDERTRVVISGDRDGDGKTDEPVLYMRDNRNKIIHPIVKKPLPAPKVTRSSDTELDDNRRYTRFFLTWVDKYGLESPVSEPSMIYSVENADWIAEDLEYMDGDVVAFEAIGAENWPEGAVSVRVYKVVTGTEEGRIQFIAEKSKDLLGSGTSGFSVKVKDEDAGEVLTEIESPPSDLQCILDVPGAFYCGFAKSSPKTVMFSDIDLLYSWPIAYRYDVKDNIVALAVTGNTVFALTDGWPYVLSGTAPESMTVTKLAGPAACVAPRGVCVYRNAVYYVSNAGLMTIYANATAGTVCENLTDKIFTKEQWQAFNPASCVMGQFDGALHLFFDKADGSHIGLTIDLTENAATAVSTHDEAAKCVCVDNVTDKMYYVREG
jgi:hypothetical protein